MTVTNWMSGLAASALGLGLRRALRISVVVLLLAAGLSIVQRGRLPPSVFEVHFWSTKQSVRDLRISRPGDAVRHFRAPHLEEAHDTHDCSGLVGRGVLFARIGLAPSEGRRSLRAGVSRAFRDHRRHR
jgi:hypothetical protein